MAEKLSKSFRRGEIAIHAVDRVTLAIGAGDYLAIVGASGSGKSTLLNLIGCLDRPSAGRLAVDGEDVATLDGTALASLRRRIVGFVFQQFNLLPRLTALQNVAVPLLYRECPRNDRLPRAERMLKRVGLAGRVDHFPGQMSGGEQQRVAIARALIGEPRLILADEPTGSLDSRTSVEILDLLEDLRDRDGAALVIVTHDPLVAARAARRIRLHDGMIVGGPDEDCTAGQGPPLERAR